MRMLLFLLFCQSTMIAQNCDRVKSYFISINEAEQFVMDQNWHQAFKSYETAFKNTKNPFYLDIVNYLNSLILSDEAGIYKMRTLTYWLNYLVNEKKVKWESINEKLISNFLVSQYKDNFYYDSSKDSTNFLSDSIILQIYNDDQNIRPKKGKYTQEDKIRIDSMDQENWIKFNDFIEKFGFPCEDNVSTSLGEYELWPVVSLLLRHFVQEGYGEEVIEILESEFNRLKIPQNIIASVYDLENNMSGGKKKHYSYNVTYITFIGANIYRPLIDYSTDNIALINENRSKIYLPNLETSLFNSVCKTMCIEGRVKYFFVEPYVSMDNLPSFLFESEEDQKMLNNLKINLTDFVDSCPCEKF